MAAYRFFYILPLSSYHTALCNRTKVGNKSLNTQGIDQFRDFTLPYSESSGRGNLLWPTSQPHSIWKGALVTAWSKVVKSTDPPAPEHIRPHQTWI